MKAVGLLALAGACSLWVVLVPPVVAESDPAAGVQSTDLEAETEPGAQSTEADAGGTGPDGQGATDARGTEHPKKICEAHPAIDLDFMLKTVEKGRGLRLARYKRSSPLPAAPRSKILGGRFCDNTKAPRPTHAVGALLYNKMAHCTGTLIGPNTVLTAAHCISGFDTVLLEFAVGPDSSNPVERAKVIRSSVHPAYDPTKAGVNDIGVVYLETRISKVEPLGFREEPLSERVNDQLLYMGYGETTGRGDPGKKRCLELPVHDICNTTFSYGIVNRTVCSGDSGGPALQRSGGEYQVAGLTAWGDEDCTQFVVSMDVGAFKQWMYFWLGDAPTPIGPFADQAPTQVAPANGSVFRHFPRELELIWNRLEGAQKYIVEVQIQNPRDGSWHPHPGISGRFPTSDHRALIEFIGDQPGRWRIHAVDASGQESRTSDWWEFYFRGSATEGPAAGEDLAEERPLPRLVKSDRVLIINGSNIDELKGKRQISADEIRLENAVWPLEPGSVIIANRLSMEGTSRIEGEDLSVIVGGLVGGALDASGSPGQDGGALLLAASRIQGTAILSRGGQGTPGQDGANGKDGAAGSPGVNGRCGPGMLNEFRGSTNGGGGGNGTNGHDGAKGGAGRRGGQIFLLSVEAVIVEPLVNGGPGGRGGRGGFGGRGGPGGRGGSGCTGLGGTQPTRANGPQGQDGLPGRSGEAGDSGLPGAVWSRRLEDYQTVISILDETMTTDEAVGELRSLAQRGPRLVAALEADAPPARWRTLRAPGNLPGPLPRESMSGQR